MDSKDGRITLDVGEKRPRLSSDSLEVVGEKKLAIENTDKSSSSPHSEIICGSGDETDERREVCRYGSHCFRSNESHLLEFHHQLLEDAYCLMRKSNDFTQIPVGFDVRDGDEAVILKQAVVLKDLEFLEAPKESTSTGVMNNDQTSNLKTFKSPALKEKYIQASHESSGSSKDSWGDALANLFEERRKTQEKIRRRISDEIYSQVSQSQITSQFENTSNKGQSENMASKWKASCPFNLFLTKVRGVPSEKDDVLSASFTDLFDASFGTIKAVCHINLIVDAPWFYDQITTANIDKKPTWLIVGEESNELTEAANVFSWIKVFLMKSPSPHGHHHTKMSIVQYTDESVRFMIYTANLIDSDWDNRTQGIWISPKCAKVPDGSENTFGKSPTNFRADILEYLSTYPMEAIGTWKNIVETTDCSSIRVFFVGSAPITSQSSMNGSQFGIKKMERILRSFEMETEPDWPLIVQCSSIGTLGTHPDDWFMNEFAASMAGKDRRIFGQVNVIYPSDQNVKDSFDGILGGALLPYSARTHMKQKWLERRLCQWKAENSGRTRAPPHIKSYSRCSPDQTKLAWFLLTSANLSKAAWGKVNENGDKLSIMSWEAGVLFIPELLTTSNYFPLTTNASQPQKFPLFYDIPLVKYEKKDTPWVFETLKTALADQT